MKESKITEDLRHERIEELKSKRIEELMSALFGFSHQTYFNWKADAKKKRKIINLLDTYFNKEMIAEFLVGGKISKFELVKLSETEEFKFTAKERLHELIKFFSIQDAKELASILAESLRNNNLGTSTAQYLDQIPNMQQCIYTLRNILNDRSAEIDNNPTVPTFELVLRDFNEKVGFDFSENDELIVTHILGRFRVYDTLYNLESTPKVLSS